MTALTLPVLFLLSTCLATAQGGVIFQNTCIDDAPTVPEIKNSCGVLIFMNQDEFGDNAQSQGTLTATPNANGLNIKIRLTNLSMPDLALTAWLVYVLPNDPGAPHIFKYGYLASPLAPTHAGFTSGLGKEPNQFEYTDQTSASLDVDLDFNPTLANEGPLAFSSFCTQRDVPGIQNSTFRQPKIAQTGVPFPNDVFVPTGSQFLREYDETTGFEKLDANGKPVLVRSPVPAFAVAIAGHIDKTTHGISPGIFSGDHYEVLSFLLSEVGNSSDGDGDDDDSDDDDSDDDDGTDG